MRFVSSSAASTTATAAADAGLLAWYRIYRRPSTTAATTAATTTTTNSSSSSSVTTRTDLLPPHLPTAPQPSVFLCRRLPLSLPDGLRDQLLASLGRRPPLRRGQPLPLDALPLTLRLSADVLVQGGLLPDGTLPLRPLTPLLLSYLWRRRHRKYFITIACDMEMYCFFSVVTMGTQNGLGFQKIIVFSGYVTVSFCIHVHPFCSVLTSLFILSAQKNPDVTWFRLGYCTCLLLQKRQP